MKAKQFTGKVVSTKMNKTVIVDVVHMYSHPMYRKTLKSTRRFAAHNDGLSLVDGDRVIIEETKPMSKTKHFLVKEKLGGTA